MSGDMISIDFGGFWIRPAFWEKNFETLGIPGHNISPWSTKAKKSSLDTSVEDGKHESGHLCLDIF